jgi:peptide-methionine (S)-S-oxide reductase
MRSVSASAASLASTVVRLAGVALLLAPSACRSVGNSTDAPAKPDTATVAAVPHRAVGTDPGGVGAGTPLAPKAGHELAAFAGGCFWGTEDVFRQVPGVTATAVGYTGGHTKNPTYPEVCTHTTGHAETVLVEFDPAKVSYADLLRVFMMNHDPTTLNRQGPDLGDQYRSEVFTFSDAQAQAARDAIAAAEKRLGEHVVTRVSPLGQFWKAEGYHQQYDEKSGTHSCPMPQGLRGT